MRPMHKSLYLGPKAPQEYVVLFKNSAYEQTAGSITSIVLRHRLSTLTDMVTLAAFTRH